ncbi:MAG: RDD family protein [Gammaproteobacteria bacterium]|nr:RDD family protein [Gammaproteobacteria bacterium]
MASDGAALRSVLTPEGVPIEVELADLGARAGAVLIDLLIIFVALFAAVLFVVLVTPATGALGLALFVILSFFLRCPFFMAFELRWRGQTPGKRVFKLRVADRRGGALSPGAVAARNLTREIEVFMPATLLLIKPSDLGGSDLDNVLALAALIWFGIFTLLPIFNRDRLRIGDMIGGTWVVYAEPVALLKDLSTKPPLRRYRFTPAELDVYGIAELQVLERLLRQPATRGTLDTRKDVLNRILDKIDWDDRDGVDGESFLTDYYAALREHLERHALFGDRRADKHEAARRRDRSTLEHP